MAKQQKRRTISVKGLTHQRLQDFCEGAGLSVSGYLEQIIEEKLDAHGVPKPTELKPRPGSRRTSEPIVSQYFTF